MRARKPTQRALQIISDDYDDDDDDDDAVDTIPYGLASFVGRGVFTVYRLRTTRE